jgi:hypothetical protein
LTPEEATAAEAMATERLRAGDTVRFIARGRSMWPFVLDGDVLVIAPHRGGLRCGDVVWRESGPVHRIIAITPGPRYWVRGDALWRPDGGFTGDDFLGRVREIRRRGRSIPVRASVLTVGAATALGLLRLATHIGRA